MTNAEIVSKLWNLCNVLRDDGITYHQYVTELTYILFLKMAKETGAEKNIPENYRWDVLKVKEGIELKRFYDELLRELGENCTGRVQEIYQGAKSNIEEPANLKKIITNIDDLDWYSAKEEGLGNLYEGLLEKNANEKKSGAGQYFTPRVLIDVMTELIAPQPGEKCNDPACGTFGFMIAADRYVKDHTNDLFDLSEEQANFQQKEAFTGGELVHETHRLALMNAMLHDIEGKIYLCDTLSNQGKVMNGYDVVLTNPPFGTKKGGERANRDDFTFQTSNKQLNFLQHIYRSLKTTGTARAAVVLPDNVLFTDGDGERIRRDFLNKCNVHTILRLPTGIFYAQGVKTNVVFFTRGVSDKNNTKEVWVYDLRTNMPSFGKTNPLKKEHFEDFIKAFKSLEREKIDDERWSRYSVTDIENDKSYSLDLGLIKDNSVVDYKDLPEPIEATQKTIEVLSETCNLLEKVVEVLKEKNIAVAVNDEDIRNEELFHVPKNWRWARIKDVATVVSKGTTPKGGKDAYVDDGIDFLRVENIEDNGCINHEGMMQVTEESHNNFLKRSILQPNDVLISIAGTLGKTAIVREDDVPLNTNQAVAFIRLREDIRLNPDYVKCYLDNPIVQEHLLSQTKVTSIPNLTLEIISECPIAIPPYNEQTRIVECVESMLEHIDNIKNNIYFIAGKSENKSMAKGYIEILKKSILNKAFTGELDTNNQLESPETITTLQKGIRR